MAKSQEVIASFEAGRRRPEEDETRWIGCLRDLQRGAARPPMSRSDVGARVGQGRRLSLPRFQVRQASGERRPIDGGSGNEHDDMVRYNETLDCPTPTHPVIQLRALVSEMHCQQGGDWRSLHVQTDEGPSPSVGQAPGPCLALIGSCSSVLPSCC